MAQQQLRGRGERQMRASQGGHPQQQQQQQQHRNHRPPPPRNKPQPQPPHTNPSFFHSCPSLVPTTTKGVMALVPIKLVPGAAAPLARARPKRQPAITATAAMDYVMNAGTAGRGLSHEMDDGGEGGGWGGGGMGGGSKNHRNYAQSEGNIHSGRQNSEQALVDLSEMHTFLNTMIQEDGQEDDSGASRKEKNGSFDSHRREEGDARVSGKSSSDGDTSDDFENNTSLSMHAEAKFGASNSYQYTSKYAEDKHGGLAETMARVERLQLEDASRREKQSQRISLVSSAKPVHGERQPLMDPPSASDEEPTDLSSTTDEDDARGDRAAAGEGTTVSPSVLPMRTMNEHLYAVEAVIPNRYHHQGTASASDALGPRSQRPGGITGVVLDVSAESGEHGHGGYAAQQPASLVERGAERERLRNAAGSSSPLSSAASSSSISTDDSIEHSSQDSLADDTSSEFATYSPAAGGTSADARNALHAMEQRLPSSPSRDSFNSKQHASTSLMMNLCSHLLPAMDSTNSLASLLRIQNKDAHNNNMLWDDEDPDEPGYIVHRFSGSQLASVENAFEKIVSLLDRQGNEKYQDNGGSAGSGSNNKNFERDLEEAELVLDQEEKRYMTEVTNTNNADGSYTGGEPAPTTKHQEINEPRESVPDFPGVYPPGKGKTGEMECFYLPIITKSQKTGFEPTKDLALKAGSIFANNYLVQSELGSAAFSTAYRCLDLSSEEDEDGYQDEVCLKVIKNTKDYFDQSLDEIKILQMLKDTGRVQENNLLEMRSFFYHREHLVIVTELLRQNLYEFGKSILESRGPLYFTRLRLSHITRQCLIALRFVHELGLVHCDIKPENILLSSYSRALVKVIDFGSSSFVTDRQSSYIQSRSYRGPEVILGLPYGGKIDMWSLGCVIAEMYTNEVTFQNTSELSMLSRIEAICGPFPRHMIAKGRNSHRIFTDSGLIYEKVASKDGEAEEEEEQGDSSDEDDDEKKMFHVYQPKMTTVAARLGFDEDFMDQPRLSEEDEKRAHFVDFVSKLLTIDPDARLSAAEALNHPWITSSLDLTEDDIIYGQ